MHTLRRAVQGTSAIRPVHILFYVGYAPGETALYDMVIEHVMIPLFFLLFSSISNFRVSTVNYVYDLQRTMQHELSLPSSVSAIDVYAYTYLYLIQGRGEHVFPDALVRAAHKKIHVINANVQPDAVDTMYAVFTYSLGSYMYAQCFDQLSQHIRDRMKYECFLGSPSILEPFLFPLGASARSSVERHYIESDADIFYAHDGESGPGSKHDHRVTNLTHYRPCIYISRCVAHLVMWADPVVWYTFTRRVAYHAVSQR
jgi:hypothetical protein